MSMPFDRSIVMIHETGDMVDAADPAALAAAVKAQAPNVDGIAFKTSDARDWAGRYDDKPGMAIKGPDDVKRWVEALAAADLDAHLWCALSGRNPQREAERVVEACAVPGVRSMRLDLYGRDWAGRSVPAEDAQRTIEQIRDALPDGFHLAVSFDPRGAHPTAVYLDVWAAHAQSLHPRVFFWEYSEGKRGPEAYLDEAFRALARYNLPVVPILPAYPDPASLARVPQGHLSDAIAKAIALGAVGFSVYRWGTAGENELAAFEGVKFGAAAGEKTTHTGAGPLTAEIVEYVVSTDLVNVRSEPGLEDRLRTGTQLRHGTRIRCRKGTEKDAEGYRWIQLEDGNWAALYPADKREIFLAVVEVEETSQPEVLVVTPEGTKPISVSGGEKDKPADGKKMFFIVADPDGLRIRSQPTTGAAGQIVNPKLQPGDVIEVRPDSRTEADGYVWFEHDRGWSAECDAGRTQIFLAAYDPTETKAPPREDWAFERLPMDLADIRWFYYYGNTLYAFENGGRPDHNYDGYSQGLHGGIDLGHPGGATVYAGVHGISDGKGTSFGPNRLDVLVGNYRIIYGHLEEPVIHSKGTVVQPDTVMGKVSFSMKHLHIEIRRGPNILNPLSFMPADLREQLIRKFPPVGQRAFYSSPQWTQWTSPLDQPVIERGRPVIGPRAT